MTAQPCLPQEILEVNKSKEYTLIATELLEKVLTDTRLNAQTSKLWQILFNKVRYNPNLEIKVSYGYLAKELNKSPRTIARYVETLQNAGYLIIQHNFDKNGGQRPNTISIRVPTVFIEHAKKKKDRLNNKHSFNNESLLTLNENEHEKTNKELVEEIPVNVSLAQNSSENPSVLCETIYDTNNATEKLNLNNSQNSPIEPCKKNLSLLSTETGSNHIIEYDKNDREGYDINVIQKDINKKDINNNNNHVVSSSQNKQRIVSIEKEIAYLEKKLAEGNKRLSTIKDHSLLYDQMRKNSEIDAALYLAKIDLERIKNEIIEKAKQNQFLNNLNNPNFMLNKVGGRSLSPFAFKRLIKSLESYGYYGDALHVLINEIVFEARFGSLINCNKTKMPLSIDNAINIGLKLVRDKRWSTPSLLKTNNECVKQGNYI